MLHIAISGAIGYTFVCKVTRSWVDGVLLNSYTFFLQSWSIFSKQILLILEVNPLTYSTNNYNNHIQFTKIRIYLNFILDNKDNTEYIAVTEMDKIMIDETSYKILKILQEKARIPNIEVSRQVGLAPSAVLERIRKMEKMGVIDGYEVRLNPEQFQCSQIAFVCIKTEKPDSHSINIGEQLSKLEEAQEVHYVAGDDCYLVKLRVANTSELNQVLHEKIFSIRGVKETKTSTVLSTYKETARIPIR